MKNYKLKNGINLLLKENLYSKSASILSIVKSGPRFDPKNKEGLSHLVEHMLFRGSEKYPSRHKVVSKIEDVGGIISAYSYYETNKYWVSIPAFSKDNIKLAMDVLTSLVLKPLFQEKDFQEEKKVINEEMSILYSNPERLIWEKWSEAVWNGNSLGRCYIGNQASLNSLTLKDVKNYFQKLYLVPENIYFICTGNFDKDVILDILTKILPPKSNNSKRLVKRKNKEQKNKQAICIENMPTKTITVALGWPTIFFSSDHRYSLDLLASYLSGGMSSRLRKSIMEQGLTYSIEAYTQHLSDTGYLMIKFTSEKRNLSKIIKQIGKEIFMLKSGSFSVKDFNRAKEYYIGTLILNNETPYSLALLYGEQLVNKTGECLILDQLINKYRSVTAKDIQKTANLFLNKDNIRIAAIGEVNPRDFKRIIKD